MVEVSLYLMEEHVDVMNFNVTRIKNFYDKELKLLNNDSKLLGKNRTCKRPGNVVLCKIGVANFNKDFAEPFIFTTETIHSNQSLVDYHCSNREGNCGCIHAEVKALMHLNRCLSSEESNYRKFTMLCTRKPCNSCAALICQSLVIGEVRYIGDCDRYDKTETIFNEAQIPFYSHNIE